MKRFSLFVLSFLLLAACQQQASTPPDATDGEIQMAEMMGITVEELRNQTPEEHMMMMMQKMMEKDSGTQGFLPGNDADRASLPEAKPREIIEVADGETIEISPTIVRKMVAGKEFVMYGFNGQIPGPIIRAKQNATITIDVTNYIDMDTTIHWHGIRLDNANDGVPDITQEVILPGETFRYTIKLPDEGIYWYHPHVREDIQQDLGLYGNLLVDPINDNAYASVNAEEILVLDDLMLDDKGNLVPYGEDGPNFPLMGRFGNLMLINGETSYRKEYAKGSIVRYYITNVANTRMFKLHFGGAKMKLVGSDVGRYENEEFIDTITIAPAERYIVDVYFGETGTYELVHEPPTGKTVLGNIVVTSSAVKTSHIDEFNTLRRNEDVIADIDNYRGHFDRDVDKTLRLTIEMEAMDHSMMEHSDDGIEWEDTMPAMNASMGNDDLQWKLVDEESGKDNMDFMWEFQKGDIVKVRIVNEEDSAHPMQHPIHFHGQRFLVLSEDGKPNENLVWKDTVLVSIGSTVDLLFDMSNPGEWMFHCHIAEHLSNGMMGMFRVQVQ